MEQAIIGRIERCRTIKKASKIRDVIFSSGDAPIQFDREEFERLVAPLVEFLQTKCHPHMSVIVEWNRASLVEDVKSVPRCPIETR